MTVAHSLWLWFIFACICLYVDGFGLSCMVAVHILCWWAIFYGCRLYFMGVDHIFVDSVYIRCGLGLQLIGAAHVRFGCCSYVSGCRWYCCGIGLYVCESV